jgi:hypothetical protein
VPQQGVLEDLLPGADARQRRVDQHEAMDAIAMLGGEGVADHVADVVGDQVGLGDLQGVEHARHVLPLRLLVVAAGSGLGRQAKTPQVGHDHGMVLGELDGQRLPHVARLAIAVQQHDGRSLAADPDVDRRAVGGDLLGLEIGGEGLTWAQAVETGAEVESNRAAKATGRT